MANERDQDKSAAKPRKPPADAHQPRQPPQVNPLPDRVERDAGAGVVDDRDGLARTVEDVRSNAAEMLGNTLVTIQTGEAGKQVNRLYITDGVDIAQEYYLALLVDRDTGRIAMVVSTGGEARRSRSAEESSRSASAEDDEAEPSMGPEVRAACVPVPVCLLAPLGGGGT